MVRLAVLGLLMNRPMSGYEIQQYLQMTQTDKWADILPGSIYHALKKMTAEGLVTVQTTEQTGFRTKVIYGVTPAGAEELRKLLREAWQSSDPVFPSKLYLAMNFLDGIPRAEVIAALDEHIKAVEARVADWNHGEAIKTQHDMGIYTDLLRATFRNGREHMEADLRLLRYLRETLPNVPKMEFEIPKLEEE